MLGSVRTVLSDYARLCSVVGVPRATRWLAAILLRYPEVGRSRTLRPADAALEPGPIRVRHRSGAKAHLVGEGAASGAREIWARDVYLADGRLHIPPDATVVDLGANMGNFTILALATSPSTRAICVEADAATAAKLRRSLAQNGWEDRAMVIEAFVGGHLNLQHATPSEVGGEGLESATPTISIDELLRRGDIDRIDFLKCDIEGSEFGLLDAPNALVDRADRIAMEVHKTVGDSERLKRFLQECGFRIFTHRHNAHDEIVLASRVNGELG